MSYSLISLDRNILHNGAMEIPQLGTTFTAATIATNNDGSYLLDRWKLFSDGNDIVDVTQSTVVPTGSGKYSIAFDVETINKKFGIAQIVEGMSSIPLQNKKVTVSFKAKVSSTAKLDNIKAAIISWTGTEDSVTADIISAWGAEGTNPTLVANCTYENTPVNLNITTNFATYSVSAILDTASIKNILVFIWSDVTDTTLGDFLYVTDTMLNIGNNALPFSKAGSTFIEELNICRRFYETSYALGTPPYTSTDANRFTVLYAYSTSGCRTIFPFFVPKRIDPATKLISYSGTIDKLSIIGAGLSNIGNTVTCSPSQTGYASVSDSGTAFTNGSIYIAAWRADANL